MQLDLTNVRAAVLANRHRDLNKEIDSRKSKNHQIRAIRYFVYALHGRPVQIRRGLHKPHSDHCAIRQV